MSNTLGDKIMHTLVTYVYLPILPYTSFNQRLNIGNGHFHEIYKFKVVQVILYDPHFWLQLILIL